MIHKTIFFALAIAEGNAADHRVSIYLPGGRASGINENSPMFQSATMI
jgi:hypothetical protein